MKYIESDHPVKRLLSADEKVAALDALPMALRRDARLVPFCADCRMPVAVDKMNRYRHVR